MGAAAAQGQGAMRESVVDLAGEGAASPVGPDALVAGFRSTADLARLVTQSLWRLPAGLALVVAIPEGGRLPAALLGLGAGLPVTDLDALLAPGAPAPAGPLLVVDDTCLTGATMAAACARLADRHPGVAIHRLAAYCRPEAAAAVDLALAGAAPGAAFEWSLLRSPLVGRTCFDLDGILCGDCPPGDDDDGPRYRRFLATATPQLVPRGRLRAIVTARLEKYRPETEAWLDRHGIACERLVMLDGVTDAERRRSAPQGPFKAAAFAADAGALLFVESESWQARTIARLGGGKPVFDLEAGRLLPGTRPAAGQQPAARLRRAAAGRLRRLADRLARP